MSVKKTMLEIDRDAAFTALNDACGELQEARQKITDIERENAELRERCEKAEKLLDICREGYFEATGNQASAIAALADARAEAFAEAARIAQEIAEGAATQLPYFRAQGNRLMLEACNQKIATCNQIVLLIKERGKEGRGDER